jgi:hypothetical protein
MNDFESRIGERLRPLATDGFRQVGSAFVLHAGPDWGIIKVLRMRFGPAWCVTAELAVFLDALAAWSLDPPPSRPTYSHGHWRSRIGLFLADRNDHWWLQDEDQAGDDLLRRHPLVSLDPKAFDSAVLGVGAAALRLHMDPSVLRGEWSTGWGGTTDGGRIAARLYAAVLTNALGPASELPELVAEFEKLAPGTPWEVKIEPLRALVAGK